MCISDSKQPEIRFPVFTDTWKTHSLGELYTERKENGNDNLPILSVSIHTGVSDGELDEAQLGKNVRRSEDKSTYKHVYSGDLVFNMMRAWQGAIGVAKCEGMISPAYISAIPNDNVYPWFMDYLLRRKEAVSQINDLSYGVTDFRKRLYWNSFINIKCSLPSVDEQKTIWSFFKTIDDAINLYQRKCDELKEFKNGLLQQMFPQAGESFPRIRFPDFTNDWEQHKLKDVASIIGGNAWKSSDYSEDGEYLVITIANVSGEVYINDAIGNHLYCETPEGYLLKEDDILVSLTGNVGRVSKMSKTKGLLNQRVGKIVPNCHDINADFLFHILRNPRFEKAMNDAGQGAAQKNIGNGDVLNYTFLLPIDKDEQACIAHCFNKLDKLITLHQRKYDELLEYKKGLLQKMFV